MAQSRIRTVEIDSIDDGAENNMRHELKNIEELAGSIEARGLLNPVVLKETDEGNFKLVAGFRRVAAHKHLCLTSIEAKVLPADLTREEELMIQTAENIDREDPNTYDIARQLKRIIEECGISREEAAKKLNKSLGWVSNYLGLFDLPEKVQEKARDGSLRIAHVRFLHSMINRVEASQIDKIANKIVGKDQTFMDKIRERVQKKIRGTGRKANAREVEEVQEEIDEEAEDMAAASREDRLAEREDKIQEIPTNPRSLMRSREVILATIQRLNEQFDESHSDKAHATLVGRVEALQWVLGDDDVSF